MATTVFIPQPLHIGGSFRIVIPDDPVPEEVRPETAIEFLTIRLAGVIDVAD